MQEAEVESAGRCPVSGLPLRCHPEWQVALSPAYQSRLKMIGDQILVSQPSGYIDLEGVKKVLAMIRSVIAEGIPPSRPFVLIEDFSRLQGVEFRARKRFIDEVRTFEWLAGVVFCSTSPLFKISVELGKRLYDDPRDVRLAPTYEAAVAQALEILALDFKGYRPRLSGARGPGRRIAEPDAAGRRLMSNRRWRLELEGFSVCMELIGDNVLHSVTTGTLRKEHIAPIARLREEIQAELAPETGVDYIVVNASSLSGSEHGARRKYLASLKQWHQEHALAMYVFYGANRLIRAAAGLAAPFIPFPVRFAGDLEGALRIIEGERPRDRTKGGGAFAAAPAPEPAVPPGHLRRYVDDLLEYLGFIDWERDGLGDLAPVDPSHPFFTVFESIALIKGELDQLTRERNRAAEQLRRAHDRLEARVRQRTASLEKLAAELREEIVERRRAEQRLKEAKLLAERASRAKSDFLANMSHELRTPLNHIIGFTELLLDKKLGALNATQEEYLNDIYESSRHLLSLIDDILDLSLVEAGRMKLEAGELDPRPLLENSLTMVREKALRHGIQLSLAVSDEVGTVCADERKLKQVMYNLLSNAVKFTPDGGSVAVSARMVDCRLRPGCRRGDDRDLRVVVDSSCAAAQEEGFQAARCLEVAVADTGIGVRSADLERIFQRFEQADGSIERRFRGAGLGLSLCKSIVELHGGRIWAESSGEGQGSTFRFVLPP